MDVEAEFIRTFVCPAKRARILELLARPKRRAKVLGALYHFDDFDPRFVLEIPSNEQNAEHVLELLVDRGAPPECQLLSADRQLDRKQLKLDAAVELVVGGCRSGTIIICLPDRLGYYEGEDQYTRHLLVRNAA